MRAFVLSGGGNLGPLQVGALRALFERNIYPDMIVGCSAGALSSAQLARDPSMATVEILADNWRSCRLSDVYPGSKLLAMIRFITGKDSLFDNRRLYAMLQRYGITPAHTFGNMPTVPLYVTATDLRTGKLHVFGDDPNDLILDALMSSTALTPLHPPWEVNGERYVDGGTVTPLPIRTALERGATEIWAMHIVDKNKLETEPTRVRGVVGVLTRSVDTMLRMQAQHDLLLAQSSKAKLHYLALSQPGPLKSTDFSRAQELMDAGYAAATAYLTARQNPVESAGAHPLSPVRRMVGTLVSWLSPRGGFSHAAATEPK